MRSAFYPWGLFLVSVVVLGLLGDSQKTEPPLDRWERYGLSLAAHPFSQRPHLSPEDWKKKPKADRPDLAFEQNWLMTMDPLLGRPAPERLAQARARLEKSAERRAKSTLPDLQWEERGPFRVGGRTRALMWDPNDASGNKVWAGGVSGGLWYNNQIVSANSQWTPVDDFWQTLSVSCLSYDPTASQTFYLGTGEGVGTGALGQGVWKSSDGGQSWAQLPASSDMHHINDIRVRAENGQGVLYVAVRNVNYQGLLHGNGKEGLFRSVDGGQSFSQVLPTIPNDTAHYAPFDIEIGADNRLWIGTTNNTVVGANDRGGATILYSDDGLNFQRAYSSNGSRTELAVAPSNAAFIYGLIEWSGQVHQVVRSVDSGATWELITQPADADPGIPSNDFSRNQAWYDLIAQVDPNDEASLVVGGINLFRSQDTGSSWQQVSHWYGGFNYPYVHADQHQLLFKPGSSDVLLNGSDGGVSLSTNFSSARPTWSDRNNRYNVTQFYAGAIHPAPGRNYYLAGSQDNGTQRFRQAGLANTTQATGGDGGYCFIDEENPNFQITSYVYNSFWRSFNGGSSFGNFFINDLSSGRFINPAAYDPAQKILYSARDFRRINRYVEVDGNHREENIIVGNMGDLASSLAVSPFTDTSSTVFVGSGAGRLYKIENAQRNRQEIISDITGAQFPNAYLSSINFGASEDELLVTFSNYGVISVWYSDDGGMSWSEKEGDLPDMPVRWALFNPRDRDMVILATELGVWETRNFSDPQPNWQAANQGLANVRVDMLQLRQSDYQILAATHGRGLYTAFFEGGIGLPENNERSVQGLKLYPNPSTGPLQIDLSALAPGPWELSLYDLQGRRWKQERFAQRRDARPGQWDLRHLPRGRYILRYQQGQFQGEEALVLH